MNPGLKYPEEEEIQPVIAEDITQYQKLAGKLN
jgi:hypothetical protein